MVDHLDFLDVPEKHSFLQACVKRYPLADAFETFTEKFHAKAERKEHWVLKG